MGGCCEDTGKDGVKVPARAAEGTDARRCEGRDWWSLGWKPGAGFKDADEAAGQKLQCPAWSRGPREGAKGRVRRARPARDVFLGVRGHVQSAGGHN